ncbi:uncharacterized protein LOC132982595 [Labrus mixtus]|uniref:uncharacterized protein LOC132982595 n=1 Tax=Labrus mixtus TaxID=508554 RepID=UPI0029C0A805|nr:uncharacterized protein LOC132982595 [Labrus mixtus]
MDELKRTGKSPTDMANQVNELMHLKYERAHLAYLQAIENVRDAEAGVYGQRTIGQFLRKDNQPRAFGPYDKQDGWGGVSVSGFYLTDCLLEEFKRQEPAMSRLLQGTFGHVFRSDHTRKVARKVTLASGVMSSYAVMNEHWLIVSWVMVQSDTERSLEAMYQGMAKRYSNAGEKAGYHWMDRAAGQSGESLQYRELGSRPVPLDWDKHRTLKRDEPAALMPPPPLQTPAAPAEDKAPDMAPSSSWTLPSGVPFPGPAPSIGHPLSAGALPKQEMHPEEVQDPPAAMEISHALPLPLSSSPRSARTGPIKTGGRVFVLDHTRWTAPMKVAIDSLLQKHHGKKDRLKLVDQDYADMVHQSATDPNSLLHPTTRLHISRYVKHLAKLLNTSSSLNKSQEKLLDTQQLWHSLTEGSHTSSVPVVTMEAAVVKPPTPAQSTPLTQDSLEKIVEGILEKQQQQQQQQQPQPEQKKRQSKTCLACGQPKSRYETDGSSIHYFFQQGPVRYFYCSKKVHQNYAAEGLSDAKIPFEQFVSTDFFQRELEETKKRVEERMGKKRKRPEPHQAGRLCRFCHLELKQGPNSPHIHSGFPGVAGKYIYCPSKVYSLYRNKGMAREMSWKEFHASPFYETERQRWVDERKQ